MLFRSTGSDAMGSCRSKRPTHSSPAPATGEEAETRNQPRECAAGQPLKELKFGRCFTYKQPDYQYLLSMLEKVFKEKTVTEDASQASGHGRPTSSNHELCGQGYEASLK